MADANQDDTDKNDTSDLDSKIKEAVSKETEGLKKKNDELLSELKSWKSKAQELEQTAEQKEQEVAEKEGDVEKLKEQLESKYGKEIEKLRTDLQNKDQQLSALVIDKGLQSALTEAGVAPQYLDAAHHLIKGKHKIELEQGDSGPLAKVDGQELNEFVGSWSQGDQGKHFIAAPNNSGGGAQGANGQGGAKGGKTITRAEFDAMSQTQRAAVVKDGATITE